MALFKKKSKDVPEDLPDLISDDLEKNSEEVHNYMKENEKKSSPTKEDEILSKSPDVLPEEDLSEPKQEVKKETTIVEKKEVVPVQEKQVETKKVVEEKVQPLRQNNSSKEIVTRLVKGVEDEGRRELTRKHVGRENVDSSFFEKLKKNLNEDLSDVSNVDEWYREDFSKRDMVSDMKEYWEDKKQILYYKLLEKILGRKLLLKWKDCKGLEKVWQSIYFELIEKEEEIKEIEAELKDLLRDFVQVCKSRKKSPGEEKVVSKNAEGENAQENQE